jgi:uncharacterized glyoxalase superfamily protein PhnB
MQFRHAAFVVRDVPATVACYQRAFGFSLRFMHPSQGYAELNTGETLLSFIGEAFLESDDLFGGMAIRQNRRELAPIASLMALVTQELEADWKRALEAGCTVIKSPEPKPWGQTVGYLRDLDGIIVESATPSPR